MQTFEEVLVRVAVSVDMMKYYPLLPKKGEKPLSGSCPRLR
jgi:hypothetical protein